MKDPSVPDHTKPDPARLAGIVALMTAWAGCLTLLRG